MTRTAIPSNSFTRAGSTKGGSHDRAFLAQVADALIAATNAGDADAVIALLTPDAVIDDPSTVHRFEGQAGIRTYVERSLFGYHTVTRFLAIDGSPDGRAGVRVDFTGDFSHEIGLLDLTVEATAPRPPSGRPDGWRTAPFSGSAREASRCGECGDQFGGG
ncbi:nuclear transport factor 2 family protein [Xanthobacter sp. VNH20]|uniref:YybH family protein n=1 Tax=Xanthobacter sp. VNH20 TaxID=3156616 RepID=UPI0032B3F350